MRSLPTGGKSFGATWGVGEQYEVNEGAKLNRRRTRGRSDGHVHSEATSMPYHRAADDLPRGQAALAPELLTIVHVRLTVVDGSYLYDLFVPNLAQPLGKL
jgi:hypothetical protein